MKKIFFVGKTHDLHYLYAQKNMDSFESILVTRRSMRKYTDQPLPADDVRKLLQAALLAPTSKNCKSWEFVAVEDKEILKQLSLCKNSGSAYLEGCAMAVVVLGDKTVTDIWVEDAAIAAGFMQLQAEALNIGSCWCNIRNRCLDEASSEDYVRDLLGIPDHFGVLCIIGFGYKNQELRPHDLSRLAWEKVHAGWF